MAKEWRSERKPVWSMDVMILSTISDISKSVSASAIQVETGNLNAIFEFRATLKELYDNMKSWLDDGDTIENAFKNVDKKLEECGYNLENISPDHFKQLKEYLNLIKKLLFRARNDLFMRSITTTSPEERLKKYLIPDENR